MVEEIAPRIIKLRSNGIRVVKLNKRRLGDNAPEGYIEIIGNKLDLYERELRKQKLEKGEILDLQKWEIH